MSTMDGTPSLLDFISFRLTKAVKARKDKAATHARTWMQTIVRLTLHVAGFICLTYAAFTFSIAAGMIVAGISCFILSPLLTSTTSTQQPPIR